MHVNFENVISKYRLIATTTEYYSPNGLLGTGFEWVINVLGHLTLV